MVAQNNILSDINYRYQITLDSAIFCLSSAFCKTRSTRPLGGGTRAFAASASCLAWSTAAQVVSLCLRSWEDGWAEAAAGVWARRCVEFRSAAGPDAEVGGRAGGGVNWTRGDSLGFLKRNEIENTFNRPTAELSY